MKGQRQSESAVLGHHGDLADLDGETYHELGERPGGKKVEDALAQVLEAKTTGLDARDDGREVVEEDEIGSCKGSTRVSGK